MTEMALRKMVVETAGKYLGLNEADSTHQQVIDLYNSHKPLARGYRVKYTDAWCATFVSAVAIAAGLTDIMPTECSCVKMTALYQEIGRWQERDDYIPSPGDIIMYCWDDTGAGDCAGAADHVGIVVSVSGSTIKVIEGNYKNGVNYRWLKINARYIRGYCLPDYGSKADGEGTAAADRPSVMQWQIAALADGFSFPKYGADGIWGKECEAVAKNAVCKRRLLGYRYKNLTRLIQTTVGVEADGLFGKDTQAAVAAWQASHGLDDDGAVGILTWKAMLGVT